MPRVTVRLPDELARALAREASRRHASMASVVRDALEAKLGRVDEPRELPFASLGRSGYTTTARDADAILEEAWAADHDR